MIVAYGIYGGSPAAESLAASLESVGCVVVDSKPALSFARNEPMTMGMGADSIAASQGNLGEASLAEWAEQSEEILKGLEEVKELLVKV